MPSKTMQSPRRGLNEAEAAVYVGIGVTLFREMVADNRMPRARMLNARRVWDMALLDPAIDALPLEGDEAADSWADFHHGNNQVEAR